MQHRAGHHPLFGDRDNIPNFEWSDLDGKNLEISVTNDECVIIVAGLERQTGIIYVLHHLVSPEKSVQSFKHINEEENKK